jgi:hypothetical protein
MTRLVRSIAILSGLAVATACSVDLPRFVNAEVIDAPADDAVVPDARVDAATPDAAIDAEPAPCDVGLTECDGVCVDTDTSTEHCGACGNACEGNELCFGATCRMSCVSNADCGSSQACLLPEGVCVPAATIGDASGSAGRQA